MGIPSRPQIFMTRITDGAATVRQEALEKKRRAVMSVIFSLAYRLLVNNEVVPFALYNKTDR